MNITKGFRIGQTLVTQEAYQRVTGTNPSNSKGPKFPMEKVKWNEAQSYCQKVGMRLPTEAEWEYAARAGSAGARYGNLDVIAWYSGNSGGGAHEVAQKAPNAWGLYDMLGGGWQWTADWFAEKYTGNAETDPQGPASGQYRALRGGSWASASSDARASSRGENIPENPSSDVGFRCAGNLDQPSTAVSSTSSSANGAAASAPRSDEAKLLTTVTAESQTPQQSQGETARRGYWKDPSTGLIWAGKDNGSDIDWKGASSYCQNLSLGGHRGWRLPETAELLAVYDQSLASHIKGGIELTVPQVWSSQTSGQGNAWLFFFETGGQARYGSVNSNGSRALCVHQDANDAASGVQPGEPVFVGTLSPQVNSLDRLNYVWIAPGTFTMGCSTGDTECSEDEKPPHRVTITKGFRIGQTPVTQEAYQRVMGMNPSKFRGPKLPVETVDWSNAQGYCQKVGMRLPTEAEWEYAARAGSTRARYGSLDVIAWYLANSGGKKQEVNGIAFYVADSGGKTHEVAQKAPNAWGLFDMLGNVWQWTADWWMENAAKVENDPQGPTSGPTRSSRGGSLVREFVLRARIEPLRGRAGDPLRRSWVPVRRELIPFALFSISLFHECWASVLQKNNQIT